MKKDLEFEPINQAYNAVFKVDKLSIGVVVPIENYSREALPKMVQHLERVQMVEQLGYKAIWLRDVPLNVPSFGDAGQTYDPFTYLGYLAGQTSKIGLGIASIALPLRHPLHVAKSAATIDQLSNGRFLLGVASGDRYDEYPAMGINYEDRGTLFRDAFSYIRTVHGSYPMMKQNHYGRLDGQVDALPKSTTHKIPLLLTGHSRQSIDWIAKHADGWMYYPRNLYMQQANISEWREEVMKNSIYNKPFMQSLYIDLHNDDDFAPQNIHLGFRLGANHLIEYLKRIQEIGVNHVALNLRLNSRGTIETLTYLAQKVLPKFHAKP